MTLPSMPEARSVQDAVGFFQMLKGTALSVLVLWTIFANTLVFIVLYKNPRLQTVPNLLVGNLAFSDLCLGVIVLPLSSIYAIAGRWLFPETLCIVFVSADILCSTASIWNLSIVGLDRYWAITTPVAYMSKRNKRTAGVMILSVWVFSLLISLAPLLGWKQVAEHGNLVKINGTWQCTFLDLPSYTIYSATGSFFIPTVVMFFVYFKIYQAFAKHRARQIYRQKVIRKHIESTILHEISHVLPTSDEFAKDDDEDELDSDNSEKDRKRQLINDDDKEVENNLNTSSDSSYSSSNEGATEDKSTEKEINWEEKRDDNTRLFEQQQNSPQKFRTFKKSTSECDDLLIANGYSNISTCETSLCSNSVIVRRQISPPTPNGKDTAVLTTRFVEDLKPFRSNAAVSSDTEALSVIVAKDTNYASSERGRSARRERNNEVGAAAVTTAAGAARVASTQASNIRFPVSRMASMPAKSACRPSHRYSNYHYSQHAKLRGRNELEKATPAISYEKVKRHKRRKEHTYRRSLQRKPKAISAAKERRGVKVLGIILGCFTICWTPFFVMYVVVQFCASCAMNKHIEMFITWLGYSNSAMNPIIYTVFNRDYQIALKRLFASNAIKSTVSNNVNINLNNKANNNKILINNNNGDDLLNGVQSKRELLMAAARAVSSPPNTTTTTTTIAQ